MSQVVFIANYDVERELREYDGLQMEIILLYVQEIILLV